MADKVTKSEAEWSRELTPEQVEVCRRKGTERPFSGRYTDCKDEGVYRCWYNTRESLERFGVKAKAEIDEQKGFDLASTAMLPTLPSTTPNSRPAAASPSRPRTRVYIGMNAIESAPPARK